QDLQFTITISSQEPTSLNNVMSALIQVLRINGFDLLEQGTELLITKVGGAKQIATVVSPEYPLKGPNIPAFITRVFKIKNANPSLVAKVVSSLISPTAIMDVSMESRNLVLTDISQNIEEVEKLLSSLDTNQGPLSIDSFTTEHNSADALVGLVTQIINPLTEGNPFIIVPQKETNTLFIISTPFLIQKTVAVLEDLDSPPSLLQKIIGPVTAENILIYHIQNKPPSDLEKALKEVETRLTEASPSTNALAEIINKMKYLRETQSFLFIGNPISLKEIKSIIENLDLPYTEKELEYTSSGFFIYKIQQGDDTKISQAIEKLIDNLKSTSNPDKSLIDALKSMKWLKETNSLLFTGDQRALNRIEQILPAFDIAPHEGKTSSRLPISNDFYVYTAKSLTGEELYKQIKEVYANLRSSDLADPAFLHTLNSAKLIPETQSIVFTGDPSSIDRIHALLAVLDQQEVTIFIYNLQHADHDYIDTALAKLCTSMPEDDPLSTTIKQMQYLADSNSFIVRGPIASVNKVKEILLSLDGAQLKEPTEFFVYHPVHITAAEFQKNLKSVASDMESSGLAKSELTGALANTRLVSNEQAVLFAGSADTIHKIKDLLPDLDISKPSGLKVEKATFLIYKIKNVSGPLLLTYIKNMASDLQRSGSTDNELFNTLNAARYVKETDSIIFTGTPSALEKAQVLTEKFDIPGLQKEAARSPRSYQIYTPRNLPGAELIQVLQDFEQNLIASGLDNKELFDTISNTKWMEKTSSILISGDDEDVKKVYDLLVRFDLPLAPSVTGETGIGQISDMSFLIYKLQYHSGAEIKEALKTVGSDLKMISTGSKSNEELMNTIKSLQWLEVTNSLIATGTNDSLAKLKELVKSIDVPLKQVFVEVLVIETTLNNTLNFGLRWGSQGNYRNKFTYATGSFPQNTSTNPDPLVSFNTNLASVNATGNLVSTTTPNGSFVPFSTGFDLGVIGDIILHKGKSYFALGSLVNALQVDADSTIVLNQKIVTQDNKNSTIFVGQNIPYTGSLVTNQSQNTLTSANLEYRDVGVSLSITPTIGNNDIITLNLEEDITEVINQGGSASSAVSTTSVTGIQTSKATTKTSVSVPDKHFLVLSGQINNSKTKEKTSIPCLGGLPLIGLAFSERNSLSETTNIIIFVRPHIIKSFDVYKEITERQEDLFRSQAIA
ncbi:MAG: hypothetical protein HYZ47_05730, partial [Simkania negevensis]|nr:hypothetical protein [Simkania negevensis]